MNKLLDKLIFAEHKKYNDRQTEYNDRHTEYNDRHTEYKNTRCFPQVH